MMSKYSLEYKNFKLQYQFLYYINRSFQQYLTSFKSRLTDTYFIRPLIHVNIRPNIQAKVKLHFYFITKHKSNSLSIDCFTNIECFTVAGRANSTNNSNKHGRKANRLSKGAQEHGEYPFNA